jgi:uncharacterized protein
VPHLPARADLDQLRHRAKDLLRAARAGDPDAARRFAAPAAPTTLAGAQLVVAREHGFASWARLRAEVERRRALGERDLARLTALLAEHPELATEPLDRWQDHPAGATPLGFVAMLRYDTAARTWGDRPGSGAVARALLAAGAPVDGRPGDRETPLITAASYGDAEVAAALVEAGADLDAVAAADAGGVPGGTALLHAAVFGMTAVVDLLARAGARSRNLVEAAAIGDVTGRLTADTPEDDRIRALVMAADHQRLTAVDQLLAAGTPIDAPDPRWGRQALRVAADGGRVAAVEHLLARGADPDHRDEFEPRTALELCRAHDTPEHARIAAILAPLTGRT